jgi:hypothetical protein
MTHTACLVCLVSTVSSHHKNTLKSKCYLQAQNKASRLRGQSGLPIVCFCFVPAASALFVEVDVSQTNLCSTIYFS